MKRISLVTSIAIALLALLLIPAQKSHATSGGRIGFSGNPETNSGATCSTCHGGGIAPTVTISGPPSLPAGGTGIYQLIISGGQENKGGLDVSATAGFLGVIEEDTDVQLVSGEVTHTAAKPVNGDNEVVFRFTYTAPFTSGMSATLYGAGNSVNGDLSFFGDLNSTDVFTVAVETPTDVQFTALLGNASSNPLGLYFVLAMVVLGLAGWRLRRNQA